jgi:hypothetical protein
MSERVTIASNLQHILSAKSILESLKLEISLYEDKSRISETKLILQNTLLVAQEIVRSSETNFKKKVGANSSKTFYSENNKQESFLKN